MNTYFNNIAEDYISAEITTLFIHDKTQDKYFNLLNLIELIPSEQEKSPLLGEKEHKYLDRVTVNHEFSIFIVRILDLSVLSALTLFENAQNGFDLTYNDILKVHIDMFEGSVLEQEPSGEYPLLIDKDRETTISMLLPFRETGFRVWTKLDRKKAFFESIDQKVKQKILKKSSQLTLKHLGFDIQIFQEHFCNIYLFACNPFIRKYHLSLLDHNSDLLVRFYERRNRSKTGCKITLWDKRADNLSFYLEKEIIEKDMRLSLPILPNLLIATLFDKNGYPLESSTGSWINIAFSIGIQESTVNIIDERGNTTSVSKVSAGSGNIVGTYDHTLAYYLENSHKERSAVLAKERKEFAFFPGGVQDKAEARIFISELVNKSSKRCILLDPYFNAEALYYAFVISKLSVPIKIIGAAFYLRKKIDKEDPLSSTYGQALLDKLNEYKRLVPLQSIECYVLKGKTSQLHDRYIVSDDNVYLLGSSFHEFGGRATTIFKVPTPKPMIDQATEWLDNESTMPLEEFVQRLNNNIDEIENN